MTRRSSRHHCSDRGTRAPRAPHARDVLALGLGAGCCGDRWPVENCRSGGRFDRAKAVWCLVFQVVRSAPCCGTVIVGGAAYAMQRAQRSLPDVQPDPDHDSRPSCRPDSERAGLLQSTERVARRRNQHPTSELAQRRGDQIDQARLASRPIRRVQSSRRCLRGPSTSRIVRARGGGLAHSSASGARRCRAASESATASLTYPSSPHATRVRSHSRTV